MTKRKKDKKRGSRTHLLGAHQQLHTGAGLSISNSPSSAGHALTLTREEIDILVKCTASKIFEYYFYVALKDFGGKLMK